MDEYNAVKSDFNEISQFSEPKWNHNNCYFSQIIKLVPDNTETCLDIGCGKGELSYMLAQKSKKVIAVDLTDGMIASEQKQSGGSFFGDIYWWGKNSSEKHVCFKGI